MQFVNHTPFPTLAFAGVDTRNETFHVVVLRQTLTWNDASELFFADEQTPLCEVDAFFNDNMQGSVREESDLCPYKPRCDVIVNATAHAPLSPDGRPPTRFDVRLTVRRPDTPAPLPPEPQGLNPHMAAPSEEMARWREAVAHAQRTPLPGPSLIDKSLVITGERYFARRGAFMRTIGACLRFGTLGLVRIPAWRLTSPTPVRTVSLRLEQAFGGECRIDADSTIANRIPAKHRIAPEQAANYPDPAQAPIAHDAFAANPAGCGFARDWYLKAANVTRISAPQIEHPAHPISLKHFHLARAGKLDETHLVAGLGIRPKGHPARARLVGTIDESFIQSDAPLPEDFNFAVWNAAWPDQQLDALQGDECIELTNLCAVGTPGARRDARGNIALKFSLPPYRPYVLVRFVSGQLAPMPMNLDTLIIIPDTQTVTATYRFTIPKQNAVRCIEARQMRREQWEEALHRQKNAEKPTEKTDEALS